MPTRLLSNFVRGSPFLNQVTEGFGSPVALQFNVKLSVAGMLIEEGLCTNGVNLTPKRVKKVQIKNSPIKICKRTI